MVYTFKINSTLLRLARHAIENHSRQRLAYTGKSWGTDEQKPAKPALMLVKDQGCYLMSPFNLENAQPNSRLSTQRGNGKQSLVVAYAFGARPRDGHIGGDDFCEDLPGLPELILRNSKGSIFINLTQKCITYGMLT